MAPNVLNSDSNDLSDFISDSEYNFMHSLIIKSKELINSVSKVKLNGKIDLLVDNIERKFNSNHELIGFEEKLRRDSFEKKDENKNQKKKRLLKITEVPQYLRFNPWIFRGYRSPDLSTMECLLSLTYFHNETINIISHSLPLLYCLSLFWTTIWWQTMPSVILSYCHCLGLISWSFGSSIYHLFMNHKSGQNCYYRLLQCDVIGIWITQSFGALSTIYSSVVAFPLWFQYFFIGLYAILSVFALREGVLANSAWKRPASFSFLFIMRIIALGLRIQYNYSIIQLIHVLMQELWPLIGAFISATRMPERFWPGIFDYYLNSHNIMHCFVVFGAIHMHLAFNNDLQWLTDNELEY